MATTAPATVTLTKGEIQALITSHASKISSSAYSLDISGITASATRIQALIPMLAAAK